MSTIASIPPVLLDHIFSFFSKPEQNTGVRKVCKTFQNAPFPVRTGPQSLVNSRKIAMGQGEYVVFHTLPTGKKQPLSPETFEKIYKILLQHSPFALGSKCADRYDLLIANLKKIDPTLEAVFIPRTLYELVFIRKCIQEDIRHGSICPRLDPWIQRNALKFFKNDERGYRQFLMKENADRLKCWHLCYFADAGDSEHALVKNIAYRLNNVVLKIFDPPSEGFTYRELSTLAEKEIDFLKTHHKCCEISNRVTPGPTTNFGYEKVGGLNKPMGIRNEMDAQIIRNAMALECSRIAQRSFFLYRGANFCRDSVTQDRNENGVYSLSYGASLFAGCLYDGGAAAYHFMRNGKNGYAVPVPFDQLNDSPFFAPTTHFVAQLFGDGEIFHGRTKAWKDFDVGKIDGIHLTGVGSLIRGHLQSNLSKEELITQFKTYKSKAIQLK